MAHTVLLELNCKPGKGKEFLPALVAALAETRARKGAGAMEPYVDADNPDRLLVWEKWDSRADQESYLQWRMETGFVEALAPVLAEPPRIIHLHTAE